MVIVLILLCQWSENFQRLVLLDLVRYVCGVHEDSGIPPSEISDISEREANTWIKYSPREIVTSKICLVEIHGGAFVGGYPRMHSDFVKLTAKKLGIKAYSLKYRLAPGMRFPYSIDHLSFLINSIPDDCDRIVLFGDSAGATHSMFLLLLQESERFRRAMRRENAIFKKIIGLVSVCGFLDIESSSFNESSFSKIYKLILGEFMNVNEARFVNPCEFTSDIGRGSASVSCRENSTSTQPPILAIDSLKSSFSHDVRAVRSTIPEIFKGQQNAFFIYNDKKLFHNFLFNMNFQESKHAFAVFIDWINLLIKLQDTI